MDHVAFFTRTVEDSAFVLDSLVGNDPRDMTSVIKEKRNMLKI